MEQGIDMIRFVPSKEPLVVGWGSRAGSRVL